jgi:hypothetical protein
VLNNEPSITSDIIKGKAVVSSNLIGNDDSSDDLW